MTQSRHHPPPCGLFITSCHSLTHHPSCHSPITTCHAAISSPCVMLWCSIHNMSHCSHHCAMPQPLYFPSHHNSITIRHMMVSSPHITLVSSPLVILWFHHYVYCCGLITMCHTVVSSPCVTPGPHHHPSCHGLITTSYPPAAISYCKFSFLQLTVILSYDGDGPCEEELKSLSNENNSLLRMEWGCARGWCI